MIMIESRLAFSDEKNSLFLIEAIALDKVVLLVNPKDMSEHSKQAKKGGIENSIDFYAGNAW